MTAEDETPAVVTAADTVPAAPVKADPATMTREELIAVVTAGYQAHKTLLDNLWHAVQVRYRRERYCYEGVSRFLQACGMPELARHSSPSAPALAGPITVPGVTMTEDFARHYTDDGLRWILESAEKKWAEQRAQIRAEIISEVKRGRVTERTRDKFLADNGIEPVRLVRRVYVSIFVGFDIGHDEKPDQPGVRRDAMKAIASFTEGRKLAKAAEVSVRTERIEVA